MKKIRLRTVFIYALSALVGALLLHTSQSVQQEETQIAEISSGVSREKESIRVLRTEWAYLNNPSRLEKLARQYLNLSPSDPGQIKASSEGVLGTVEFPAGQSLQPQPVSLAPRPLTKPAPPRVKSSPKEKSLDDLLEQVAREGGEE